MAVRVAAGRAGRTVKVTAEGGATRNLSVVPTGWTADGGAEIAQLDREGREALTRRDGPRKKTLAFSINLGRVNPSHDVQGDVNWMQRQRDAGRRIKFSNMPSQWSGWWLIDSLPIEVTRMNRSHLASRATLNFRLIAYLDVKGRVTRTPPPRRQPSRSPSRKPAKQPVYRYHTVVRGDWLSKIARRYLGDMNRWPEIYRLNKKEIDRRGNPDLIFPGQRFKIPPK